MSHYFTTKLKQKCF